jgi:antitoxin component HigA of HigAB toxin-antitoxin module
MSDVLNRKRPLSMRQIVKLYYGLVIPYENLIDVNVGQ